MRILFIEPYFGGSHRAFAEGLKTHSYHDIDLITLPDSNWDWRMRGAALYFAKKIEALSHEGITYDGVIISSMIRLSDLKAILGDLLPPVIVYFHESQLTYPSPSGKKQHREHVMNDISTALVADRVLFNSSSHLSGFMNALASWSDQVPDYPVPWIIDDIRAKSSVLYPGIDIPPESELKPWNREKALIIWNHRWSYDKNAPSFFYAIDEMIKRGVDFDLALLGECPGWMPQEFIDTQNRLNERIIQFGYVESRKDYVSFLESGSIVVSTAKQENFGIAVVEAMRCGCLPLLPDRLSYPELLPVDARQMTLYTHQKDFLDKLENLATNWKEFEGLRQTLSTHMKRFSWKDLIGQYDTLFHQVFKCES